MADILCMTSGLRGLLNASFELVARLQQAGHSITYACPHDVSDEVRAQGIRYRQLPAVDFSPAPQAPRVNPDFLGIRSRLAEWLTAAGRRREGVQALGMTNFQSFLDDAQPDLVLVDSELYEHIFAVHDAGYSVALITPFFATWKAIGLPPLQSDIIPGQGFRGSRVGLEIEWLATRMQRWLQVRKTSVRSAFTERRAVLRRYAKEVSYPLISLEQYSWVTLFNDNRLPVLSLTAEELEFPHDHRPGLHYIGPMVAVSRRETRISDADAGRLQEIYAEKSRSQRQLIYCWLTTMDDTDKAFLKRVIAAVSLRPEWLLVIGASGDAATNLGELPAHIHRFDYVPQIEVLQNAELCITHGGVNTINECLTCAVPMLIYSTGSFDKHGCAARIACHGLGLRANINRDDAEEIARKIEKTLADEGIRNRVLDTRDRLERYREQRIAETVIDKLLQDSEGNDCDRKATP